MKKIITALIAVGLMATGASAANFVPATGDWDVASNWNPAAVPDSSVSILINGSRTATVQAAAPVAECLDILLGAGSAGSLVVNGTFNPSRAIDLGLWNTGAGNGTLQVLGGTVGVTSNRRDVRMGLGATAPANYNGGTIQIGNGMLGGTLNAYNITMFNAENMLGTCEVDVQSGTLDVSAWMRVGSMSGDSSTAILRASNDATFSAGGVTVGDLGYGTSGRISITGSDVSFNVGGGMTLRSNSEIDFFFDGGGVSPINANAFWYTPNVTVNVHGISELAPGTYDLLVGNTPGSSGHDLAFNISGFYGEVNVIKDTSSGLTYSLEIGPEMEIDGVPVSWIYHYFNTTDGFSGSDDSDSDSVSNEDEYLADTDPTDPESSLKMLNLEGSATSIVVTYQNGGSNANVFVEYRAGAGASWGTIDTKAPPTSTTNTYIHSNTDATGWYRVKAQRP